MMPLWLSRDLTLSAKTMVNLDRLRHGLAALALVWFVVVSVTASLKYSTLGVTRECVLPVWAFVLVMWPEMVQETRLLLRSKVILATLVVLVICACAWLLRGYSIHEPRLRFMLGVALLFPAAAGWFRQVGPMGMQFAFVVKAGVLAFACFKFGVAIFQNMPAREIMARPPIYRHLRHLNYDLALISGMAGGVFAHKASLAKILWCLTFVLLGYFSFWSGGRGQFLTLGVVLISLGATMRASDDVRFAGLLIIAFLLGGLGVILSGETGFLLGALERSSRENLDMISTGRLAIWVGTLSKSMSSLGSALFGFGPEAFERMGLLRSFIVHPHNVLVQWVLEYGLLGAGMLMASGTLMGWRCVLPALLSGEGMDRVCAATVIGMTAFAMVDGVYYHAAPLLFITLMWAYLFARKPGAFQAQPT